jgi:hypothetical protein
LARLGHITRLTRLRNITRLARLRNVSGLTGLYCKASLRAIRSSTSHGKHQVGVIATGRKAEGVESTSTSLASRNGGDRSEHVNGSVGIAKVDEKIFVAMSRSRGRRRCGSNRFRRWHWSSLNWGCSASGSASLTADIDLIFLSIEFVIFITVLPNRRRCTTLAATTGIVDVTDPGISLSLGSAEEDKGLLGSHDSELHVGNLFISLARNELDIFDGTQEAKDLHPVTVRIILTRDEETIGKQEHILLLDTLLNR